MAIGELSAHAGVAASAIRYYESLAVIQLARQCGFRLNEIGQLLRGIAKPSVAWKSLAASKGIEINEAIKQLLAMRRLLDRVESCRCPSILECGKLSRQPY